MRAGVEAFFVDTGERVVVAPLRLVLDVAPPRRVPRTTTIATLREDVGRLPRRKLVTALALGSMSHPLGSRTRVSIAEPAQKLFRHA